MHISSAAHDLILIFGGGALYYNYFKGGALYNNYFKGGALLFRSTVIVDLFTLLLILFSPGLDRGRYGIYS